MREKKNRLANKGRSNKDQFVLLPFWMLSSDAYRDLRPGPRALLVEFHKRFNGHNNGKIIFSQRHMAEAIKISDRQTVAKYIRELERKGFIHAIRRGGFNLKSPDESRATVWALSIYAIGDRAAQKTFMRWKSKLDDGTDKPACQEGKISRNGAGTIPDRSNVKEFPSQMARKGASSGTENPSTYTSKAIGTGVRG